ncbi:MAG TPA: 1-acyl-sn-glycerol-3-phosphate acyltransferase [Candidatus Acetothermia bacterium]|nr:1-acyl-sn-glycerol-3-phosphate acyltransferase [Candidatus Acetothermia bacterium]
MSGTSSASAVGSWLADRVRDVLYGLLVILFWPSLTVLFRLSVRGRSHLRTRGIVVAPHRSYWDIFVLAVACGPFRRITFLAREGLLRHPVFAPFVWGFAVVIDREAFGVGDFRRTLAAASRAKLLGIFPEGTTRPGARPKSGAIRLAERLDRPLVPVNIVARGPYPPARFLKIPVCFPRIEVRIGPPVTVGELGRDLPPSLPRSDRHYLLTSRLMELIQAT